MLSHGSPLSPTKFMLPNIDSVKYFCLQMRGLGAGAAATANWLSNAVISHTFLPLAQAMGGSGAFWIYAAITACGTAWAYVQLPETKGGCPGRLPELCCQGNKHLRVLWGADAVLY